MANTPNGKLHCPNCKSHNISITTETSVNSAMTTHHSHHSSTLVSNSHRNYWVCSDCGTKFRNLQNLDEEIQKSRKTPIVMLILAAISFVISLAFSIMGMDNMVGMFIFFPLIFAFAIGALAFFIMFFVCKSQTKKMEKERDYLKQNCFD